MVGAARRFFAVALSAAVALSVLSADGRSTTNVDAREYDAFWLWAGVRPQPVLSSAKRVYLLQAEVKRGDPVRVVSQRPAVPAVRTAETWLVWRVETLAWSPEVYATLLQTLARWRAAGNRVAGVQIDFDAHTRHLSDYARFLADLRRCLPPETRLGVTGLLDWSANADPAGLAALGGTVDEIVLQIYQGRHVIPGYAAYLAKLDRLDVPFRVGLLQGGEWEAPAGLARHPRFAGYVVFLRNE